MKSFEERWKNVEHGKREMKLNLIRYNNIVKVQLDPKIIADFSKSIPLKDSLNT